MKRLFLLLALVGMIATSCEDSGIEEPSNPIEQPDDNTDQEQPGDDNTDEEQPGDDGNKDDENNTEEEKPVFEIDGPGKYTIGAEGGSIDVVVTTNLEYRLEVSEDAQSWLTIADTRAVRTERLTISVSPNNTDSERTATISVLDGADNKVFSFTLTQEYANLDEIIKFVDNTTKTICLINWDTNGDAELSIGEAVAVTDIGTKFQSKDIMAFDEFKYFTGVTTIVTGAFKDCANLIKISIPDSVTTIGDSAFSGCTGELIINSKIVETDCDDRYAPSTPGWLKGSNFSSLTIGNGVTAIGRYAFYDCDSLTSITIPDSVTTIGEEAFKNCSSLTSVTIGDGVTTIGDSAFSRCNSLTEFNGKFASEDGRCLIVDGVLNSFAPYGLTEYAIPDSVTTIGRSAFSGCASLTSITIPDSVTTIGDWAFAHCDGPTSITIGDGVTTIGEEAFSRCNRLTSVIIGDSVTTIGDRAFFECDSLTSVTITDSVKVIGIQAFCYCSSLTEFKGSGASSDGLCIINNKGVLLYFLDKAPTEYIIPDSVTEIGDFAFVVCSSLTSVTIGDGVTKIGYVAFWDCDSLTSVYCKATTPPALGGNGVFVGNPSGRKIYAPTESVDAYKSAKYWSDYADDIVGYDFENGVVVE